MGTEAVDNEKNFSIPKCTHSEYMDEKSHKFVNFSLRMYLK